MCTNHRLLCNCGREHANVTFRNHILPPGVISNLYCPQCSAGVSFRAEQMIADNDWILDFDMQIAGQYLQRAHISASRLIPAFLFDEGYATWNGLTPTDLEDRQVERQEIIALARQDMRRYLAEMSRWGCERVQKLSEAGWRKAQEC